MEPSKTSVVIVGAGVVGCATAMELSEAGFEPIVLEKGPRIAEGITSRNSGVIHAGLYYPPHSLKAQACIRGNALLYEWCERHGVPFKKTGKWVVGQSDEEEELLVIHRNAIASGVQGLEIHAGSKLSQKISGLTAEIGFFSPKTGIVDPYEYSLSMRVAAEARGALFLTQAEVYGVAKLADHRYRVLTSRDEIEAEVVVNSAGLAADEVAGWVGVDRYKIYPWRGDYFRLKTAQKYENLIYPVKKKNAAGLGIHLTLGLDGSYRLGPDVQLAKNKNDFGDPPDIESKKKLFAAAASRYLGEVRPDQLSYDSCGIRPKLRSPEDSVEKDFVIAEDLPGFINLMGIESPGLTASRDLAQRVAKIICQGIL